MKENRLSVCTLAIVLFGILMFSACMNPESRAKTIVSRCAEAMGGMDKIENLRTLIMDISLPGHGDIPSHYEIRRPNQLRYGFDSSMMFDGKRLYSQNPPSPEGEIMPAEIIDADEAKDAEIDIAWFIPAFFEYPAEYLGSETAGDKRIHKLGVNLPLEGRMTYFIDGESFLIVKAVSKAVVHGKARSTEREYKDYREVDGILFPMSLSFHERVSGWMTIEKITVNGEIPDNRFMVPEESR